MSPSDPVDLNPAVRRFIQEAGHLTQSLGVGRVVGQVYAYLYFTEGPRSLSNLQKALGISKGAASMSVRQLEQWGAVRKVWVRGDRKDYYEANDWLGRIAKNMVGDIVGRKIMLMESALSVNLDAAGDGDAYLKKRMDQLSKFHGRVRKTWGNPLIQKLLR